MTCFFIMFGLCIIAGIFAEVGYQIFLVHRDTALREAVNRNTAPSASSVDMVLDRQINLKFWSALWMIGELIVVIFFGVGIIYTVEDWSFGDSFYWAVQTAFAVGYGDFAPKTLSGRWVAITFMVVGCFIVINILASFASLPSMYHRRAAERIILAQFKPSDDSASSSSEMERLKQALIDARMAVSGPAPTPSTSESEQEPILRGGGAAGQGVELNALFGEGLVSASIKNCRALRDIAVAKGAQDGSSQQPSSPVTRDEFTLWLLMLLGRIDMVDIKACREVFDTIAASAAGGKVTTKQLETSAS